MSIMMCGQIRHGLYFEHTNKIKICCRTSHIGGGNIVLLENFDPKHIDIDLALKRRAEILKIIKSGKIYHKCEGCSELTECDDFDENSKINVLLLQHWTKCNCNCIYCYSSQDKKYFNSKKNYEIYPVLKHMAKKDILGKNGVVFLVGGEVSCLNEFKKLVKLFDELNYFIIIPTSAIKYEKIIEKRLKKGNSIIIVSIDAGTKALHEKIKQVKKFDKVWSNIAKYQKNSINRELVAIKYIVIPKVNDSEEEINLWLKKCKETGIKNVILDFDSNYYETHSNNIPDYIYELFEKTKETAESMGLTFFINNIAKQMFSDKHCDKLNWYKYVHDPKYVVDEYFKTNSI